MVNRSGTQVTSSRLETPAAAVLRLVAIRGPGGGRSFTMTKAIATVGRHATNDLALADPAVSGVHLELRREGALLRVRDVGSVNGTWLGESRVLEIDLAPGAEVRVGGTVLRVEIHAEIAPAQAPTASGFGELVGQSISMRELFATLARVSAKQLSILVQGETGTGKEAVARAIHAHSPRAAKPFVVIDATALPESLVESLLFGHERGAFTGADQRRVGLFEAANGGTVFLDEIGELPALAQAKFLGVLERRELQRVGATSAIKVDVRVVAATNRDLRHEVEAGRFREDLFFRLAQMHVHVPPLRARAEDIPLLCEHILENTFGAGAFAIDEEALRYLQEQSWPGNVRELRNVLQRAGALANGKIISRKDVAGEGFGFRGMREERAPLDVTGTFAEAKERAVERFEMTYLAALMKRCAGNLSLASRKADVGRQHLRDRLKKRGLYGVGWDGEEPDET